MGAIDLKKAWETAVKPPEGWRGDLFFYNREGQKIRYGYAPALGEKKGAIVLTHGYAEHIDLYYETIKKYQQMGYEVWGMDWRGQGLSDRDDPDNPLKPGAQSLMRHVEDLDYFVRNLVKPCHDPAQPLVMSTHSMGGHIALLYLKQHPGVFDAAILSAPMLDIYRLGLGNWARPIIRGIFNAASALGYRDTHVPSTDELWAIFGKVGNRLSNTFKQPATLRGEFRELVKDLQPDARLGRPTFGWVAAAYKTIDISLRKDFLKSIDTPILIGSAENEDLVDNNAHKRAAALMPNAEHVLIAGAAHGLWFENDGPFKSWWGHITGFLERLGAPARKQDPAAESQIARRDAAKTLHEGTDGFRRAADPASPGAPDGPRPA